MYDIIYLMTDMAVTPYRRHCLVNMTMLLNYYEHCMMLPAIAQLWAEHSLIILAAGLWRQRVAHDCGVTTWTLHGAHDECSSVTVLHQTQVSLHWATESHVSRLVNDTRCVASRCDPVRDVKLEVVNDNFAVFIRDFDLEALCEPPILSCHHTERHARLRHADSVERNLNLAAKENTRYIHLHRAIVTTSKLVCNKMALRYV